MDVIQEIPDTLVLDPAAALRLVPAEDVRVCDPPVYELLPPVVWDPPILDGRVKRPFAPSPPVLPS